MSAPRPEPFVLPAVETRSPEQLLAMLEQMVSRCEEMVESLARAAVEIRTDRPARYQASNSNTD